MNIALAIMMIALALWNAAYCIVGIAADRKARRTATMLSSLIALMGVVAPLIVLAIIIVRGS